MFKAPKVGFWQNPMIGKMPRANRKSGDFRRTAKTLAKETAPSYGLSFAGIACRGFPAKYLFASDFAADKKL
jgi:hypothetical protein